MHGKDQTSIPTRATLSSVSSESEKKAVGEAAALLADGVATLGLGTGSTVTYLLHALAARGCKARCVATSVATEELGRSLGLFIEPFDALSQLDLAIDGADQIDPDFWVIKGGGGAHTREKIVANAAQRFVVIADHSKMVEKLSPPLPLEIFSFGLEATLAHIRKIGPVTLREVSKSPDGGVIADYHGTLENPYALGALLHAIPGVVDHGLFAPSLISDVLVAQGEKVTRLTH